MLDVSKIWARSMDLDFIDVWWEIEDTVEDRLLYSFYLERSESPAGPWDTIGGPLKDKWHYRDQSVNQRHRHRKYFYRLKMVEDSSGDEGWSEPTSKVPEPDLIAREMAMRLSLVFREYNARWVIALPVRTFGTRCPDCWDEVRQRRQKDRCMTCYGTSYAGGYMSPVPALIQIDPSPATQQVTGAGETQTTDTSARALPFPSMKPNDLLIETENKRWKVTTAGATRKLRAVVHYELQLHEVPPGDIVFKVPVEGIDMKNFQASPGREFVNPYGLEVLKTREPGIENILIAYGYTYVR